MSIPESLLHAQELGCIRDRRELFNNLNLTLAAGELLHVEGANGAGKTSLLRILCGLLLPQAGAVYWRGAAISSERARYYHELLYIGHSPGLKDDLSALENLVFYQALGACTDEAEYALEQVGLYGFEDVPLRALSAGQRRRAGLARLWLSRAPLWILDEPLTALDSAGCKNLTARLQDHSVQGGCIILTSHQALSLPGLKRLSLG